MPNFKQMAETYFKQVNDCWRTDRDISTAKRHREATNKVADGVFYRKCSFACDILADGYEAGMLPDVLLKIKTKSQVEASLHNPEAIAAYNSLRTDLDIKAVKEPEEVTNWLFKGEIALKKIDGYFPTPPDLLGIMMGYAVEFDYENGQRVLEPSAGMGHIAWEVRNGWPGIQLDCVEYSYYLSEVLRKDGFNVIGDDFMEFKPEHEYDHIIMNPPFEKKQDVKHIMKALAMVKEGGSVIAICSASVMTNEDKETKALRALLTDWSNDEENGGFAKIVRNPAGSFLNSERPTAVNTARIMARKPVRVKAVAVETPIVVQSKVMTCPCGAYSSIYAGTLCPRCGNPVSGNMPKQEIALDEKPLVQKMLF